MDKKFAVLTRNAPMFMISDVIKKYFVFVQGDQRYSNQNATLVCSKKKNKIIDYMTEHKIILLISKNMNI